RHLDQALHIGSQLFAARGAQGAAQAQPLEA
ncbi:flavodoxin family protein, partial [Pseudomonas aeruginosa]|nr:flavodoxin family protein [Pseudomonas aeruginosa]